MKLKLFLTAAVLSAATALSVSAMSSVTGTEGMADDTSKQSSMLAVTTTDSISIDVEGVTGSLTLLSYKNGETPSPDNIQYIRQYTPDSSNNVNVSFQIRSIIPEGGTAEENGLYCVKLNDGAGEVKTLYYKVGKPVSVNATNATYYQRVDFEKYDVEGNEVGGTTSVAYKADFTVAGGNISEYGFRMKYNGGTEKEIKYTLTSNDNDIGGAFSFGTTIFEIPTETADEDIPLIEAVPFVNYVETNNQ